ncbi:MAG: hypothetical protein J6A61_04485 [Clostridia bacterium]|nr:hypothetical protein [Clostridia bacterium]
MKKIVLLVLIGSLLTVSGCSEIQPKNRYLPKVKNDTVYTTVDGEDTLHRGDGYELSIPSENYHYEKDYDDGALEESWESIKKDDVKIKVYTYQNTDEITARSRFLRENEDYIFEDMTGDSICGTQIDGDILWFYLHQSDKTVYIISWEYPKHTKEVLQTELANIAGTFRLTE